MKTRILLAAAILALSLIIGVQTAALADYSAPVSWSPMTMLNITLTADNKLSIVPQTTTIQLAYDTYSDPNVTSGTTAYGRSNYTTTIPGTFDPSQPWGVLNGTAFSRQLGWNPGTGMNAAAVQAAFGSGAGIWIQEISSSAGLETYLAVGKFGVNSNNTATVDPAANAYTGIFGTNGSSQAWKWDYMMDHNTNTVPLSSIVAANQQFSATYRLYIGDADGNDIAPGAATTTTWNWTANAVPTPIPGAVWLLGSGLVGLIGLRKRRKG